MISQRMQFYAFNMQMTGVLFSYWQSYQYFPVRMQKKKQKKTFIDYTSQLFQANNFFEIWAIYHGVVMETQPERGYQGEVNSRNTIRLLV